MNDIDQGRLASMGRRLRLALDIPDPEEPISTELARRVVRNLGTG